jgi:hypothetical protein
MKYCEPWFSTICRRPEAIFSGALAVKNSCKTDMIKGCEKSAFNIMFPDIPVQICIKVDIDDLVYRGSPLFVVEPAPFFHQP